MRKIGLLLVFAFCVLVRGPDSILAESVTGSVSEFISYSIDSDGILSLTFNETEEFYDCDFWMPEYESAESVPWHEYRDRITGLQFDSRICSESVSYWFTDCSELKSVPVLPSGVKSMVSTFEGTGVLEASIPASAIDCTATFKNCKNLKQLCGNHYSLEKADEMYYGCSGIVGAVSFTLPECSAWEIFSGTGITSVFCIKPSIHSIYDVSKYCRDAGITCNSKTFLLKYELSGGTLSSDPSGTYSVFTENLIASIPTRKGYTFIGWFLNSEPVKWSELLGKGFEVADSNGNLIIEAAWLVDGWDGFVEDEDLGDDLDWIDDEEDPVDYPDDDYSTVIRKKIFYKSSDTSVASVGKYTGIVTKKSPGIAVITRNDNGSISTFRVMVYPKRNSITKCTSKNRKIRVSWKRVSGVDGYKVQYAYDKKFKNKKSVNTKKLSHTFSVAKKGFYWVRVAGYKTVEKTSLIGKWSPVMKIKVL